MRRLIERWRTALLTSFTGRADGEPEWVLEVERGADAGYFGPGSAAWAVHGSTPTLVAGIRALLMQTLHPGAMAGVHDFSRYKSDPLGRLSGTIRWLVTVTFGDTEYARRESQRVGRFHARVQGEYVDDSGAPRPYSAGDPELLTWVHLAFTDAFLGCHLQWGDPIPGGADRYVEEWATAGRLVGVPSPPRSAAELRDRLDAFREAGVLRRDERVDEAVRFIRNPPLDASMMLAYRILFAGAVATIPVEYRRLLGLRRAWWPARTLTAGVLSVVTALLGEKSHSELAALRRIRRIGRSSPATSD